MNENVATETHAKLYWAIKVAGGFALIAGVVARFVFGVDGSWSFPIPLAQVMVVVGGSIYILHYYWLRADNPDITQPQKIVMNHGLYRLVRHPMYLADLLAYAGLALLWFGPLSLTIWLISAFALCKQAKTEDDFILRRWRHTPISIAASETIDEWHQRTRLIIPFVY